MRIVYHGHSGFSVQTEKRLLIFDYLGKGLPAPEPGQHALALVSHWHKDHFWRGVDDWAREGRVRLLVGKDVRSSGTEMSPGDCVEENGALVRAFGSTDTGVSFLVEAEGHSVFHAGDFNLWHWRSESTEQEVREAVEAFERILKTLKGVRIDVAFFPVDPRMGEGCEEGALRFAQEIRPKMMIPMHFWDQPQTALDFAKRELPDGVRAHAMTVPGEEFLTD